MATQLIGGVYHTSPSACGGSSDGLSISRLPSVSDNAHEGWYVHNVFGLSNASDLDPIFMGTSGRLVYYDDGGGVYPSPDGYWKVLGVLYAERDPDYPMFADLVVTKDTYSSGSWSFEVLRIRQGTTAGGGPVVYVEQLNS